MLEKMNERCQRICGSAREHCFIDNKKQIECIADMVINKVFGIMEIIELTMKENQYDKIAENLTEALKNMHELINWIKFLQIAHDLRMLSSLSYVTGVSEKRTEIRYPLPEIYQKYIVMKINISGLFVPALIMNFSQHGIQFKCPEPLDINSLRECILSTTRTVKKELSFKARIKYCTKHNGEFIVGGQIEEITDKISFNFFKAVYDLIVETALKSEVKPADQIQ